MPNKLRKHIHTKVYDKDEKTLDGVGVEAIVSVVLNVENQMAVRRGVDREAVIQHATEQLVNYVFEDVLRAAEEARQAVFEYIGSQTGFPLHPKEVESAFGKLFKTMRLEE